MWPNNDRIGETEIVVLVTSNMVGVGIITLPAVLARTAGPDAWISVLLACGLGLVGAYAITRILCRFPGKGLVSILTSTGTRWFGRSVGLIFGVYFIVTASISIGAASEQFKLTLLPNTPVEVIIFSLLLVVAYVARGGLEPISRTLIILFPLLFVPFAIILLALKDSHASNFLPVLAQPPINIVKGAIIGTFSFLGFEGLLVWATAMQQPKRLTRAALKGIYLAGILYLLLVVVATALFSQAQLEAMMIPIKSIVDSIATPLVLIERVDAVVFAIWITFGFSSLLLQVFTASRFLQDVMGLRSHTPLILPLLPIVFIISLIPKNTLTLEVMKTWTSPIGFFLAIVFPLIFWAWLVVRDRMSDPK